MKLLSLRLHGFKSFADRTEIRFHDGITTIVGPNGCGKSNISDAVRWVLGEQRPTAIRGAKMEEAIFQGTVNRRPVNRGSVTMAVSNGDGTLPVPFEEVEISRTVYRDGGSEYSLNRSPCRLRDIQDLCRDTGLGANAYSVIESRMIDAILSDRADERRGLFEEAAGIGKYKDRRKAASRRLERAELDLQRLDDVIGEVQTKVRSLARQKGRAQRYQELRDRRLALETSVFRGELQELDHRLQEIRSGLEGDEEVGQGLKAEIRTAEARVAELRLQQTEAEKARARVSGELDEVRTRLVRWERDLAVAQEKASSARRRTERIHEEREEAERRLNELGGERQRLAVRLQELEGEHGELASNLEERRQESKGVQERLKAARAEEEALETRSREVVHRGAQLEGDAESAREQEEEMDRRLGRMEGELKEAEQTVQELDDQGDLFTDRRSRLTAEVEERRSAVEAEQEGVRRLRVVLDELRAEELAATDRSSALGAEVQALERMERDQEGVDPVIQAVLEEMADDVLGIVSDFLSGESHALQAAERYLGALSRALVVRDRAAARRVARWFLEEWEGGGGLILLPADVAGDEVADDGVLEGVKPRGAGAGWVRKLLAGVALWDEEGEAWPSNPGAPSVEGSLQAAILPSGTVLEKGGAVRVGNPLGATGLLERRERLAELHGRLEELRNEQADRTRERKEGEERLRAAEEGLEEARTQLREAEDEHREAMSEEAAHSERRTRIHRQREEVERQLEALRSARDRARQRGVEARQERAQLAEEESRLHTEREKVRVRLNQVQEEWERARDEESRLSVEETRLQGEILRAREKLQGLDATRGALRDRMQELDREEEELAGELERCVSLQKEGGEEMEGLFEDRTRAEARLRERDEALQTIQEALKEGEARVRSAREVERDAQERRHGLELERREVEGRIERIRDRLEGEWGRSLEALLEEAEAVDGDPTELRTELQEVVQALDRLGPVNMLAVEEHEEESRRLAFLEGQREDLVGARDDLRTAIDEINRTATQVFSETFDEVRDRFRATFQHLFQGGECDLWLEDPDDPLESAVEIHASPVGKRTQRIDLLSGGERALTALALLFGIYLVKPSPFCVLDEVDAPLDESNIGRFIRLLEEFKEESQFVVITHNPRTIEAADWIYGVTMEEPGVSSIVGVRLEEALEATG